MNRHALYHAPDSPSCCPVSEHTLNLRLRAARGDLVSAEVLYGCKYVFQTERMHKPMCLSYQTELYDWYTVSLEVEDTRLAYIFLLDDGHEKLYFSEDGATPTYDFDKSYYNFFQYAYINKADVRKPVSWMESAVFYQIFVDRFARGSTPKDTSYINLPWGEVPRPKSFAGGDLDGITEHLDYIQSLGCNALYITPVFLSPSNHKYDIVDYYQVDPMFGGRDALRRLTESVHARGMHIILDGVFNHVSEHFAPFRDFMARGQQSPYADWFILHGRKPRKKPLNYEVFASCSYMPKLNTSNQAVQSYLINIGTHYIKEFGIDGWRLDVCDEVSRDFWRHFRAAIKWERPDAVLIGENWHDAGPSLRGDQLDGIMNYALTKACLDYFAWGTLDAQSMAWKLSEILMRNPDPVNAMMLNLLDSHDTHRFLTETQGDREALEAALSLLCMFPGAPCFFYGTETYTMGGYDPDCRRCMNWGDVPNCRELLHTLAGLPRKGPLDIRAQDDTLILQRGDISLLVNRTQRDTCPDGRTVPARSHILLRGGDPLC